MTLILCGVGIILKHHLKMKYKLTYFQVVALSFHFPMLKSFTYYEDAPLLTMRRCIVLYLELHESLLHVDHINNIKTVRFLQQN